MKKTRKRKKKKIILKRRAIILLLIIIIILICIATQNKDASNDITIASSSISEIEALIEKETYADVSRYIVYGTHLNIEGNINIPNEGIENVEVIARSTNGDEIGINTTYEYTENTLEFSTLDKINTGLDLEKLEISDYYVFLKVRYTDTDEKYYSLSNKTEYTDEINYYTLTRNDSNNKINIKFTTNNDISTLVLNVTKADKLPEDVYDIVIDPGHGGSDGGAVSGRYEEANIVLDCAKQLKEQLEELGLKVLITRDGTETDEYNMYNIYDEEGRVTMANKSGAKILISLHLNSNEIDITYGGVEVYASPNSDLTLAKKFADNIVNTANTTYSQMESYKEEQGVYVRTIEVKNNRRYGSSEYKGIFDSIPYLYIIREIGGIATGAYVDGTDNNYSENIYRNSNVGVEGYLIELGYMNVNKDLRNILNNQDLYIKAITESIKEVYEIK